MKWDADLQKTAQVWADHLKKENTMAHDPNLGDVSKNFNLYGLARLKWPDLPVYGNESIWGHLKAGFTH